MKSIVIGRGKENDVVLEPQDISTNHARITDLGNGEFKVEDLDSTNGVYVNGYRIKSMVVSSDDQVRLSAKHIIDLNVLFNKKQGELLKEKNVEPINDRKTGQFQKIKQNKQDYTEEFAKLKQVYDSYYRDKKRIIEGNQRKQTLIYLLFMSIPLGTQLLFKNLIISGVTIVFGSLARILPGATKYLDKLEELNDSFMVRFVCPNKECNQMLAGRSWTVWHDTGSCPKCNAIYNKNKL